MSGYPMSTSGRLNKNAKGSKLARAIAPSGGVSKSQQPVTRRGPRNRTAVSAASAANIPMNVARQMRARAPQVVQRPNGMVVRHRELLQNLSGSSAFSVILTLALNPGMQQTFPWLSTVASRFETYKFRRLCFGYQSIVGPASADAVGSLVFVADYDALDSAPANLAAAMQMLGAHMFPSYGNTTQEEIRFELDPRSMNREAGRYVRTASVPSGADAKTYDVGNFFACADATTTSALGRLFVEYEVELFTPQQAPLPVGSKYSSSAGLDADSLIGTVASVSTTSGSNAGWTLTDTDTFTCTIPGTYYFLSYLTGTTLVGTSINVGSRGTASLVSQAWFTDGSSGSGFALITALVGQTFKPAITSAAAVSLSTFRICQANPAM